jgi:ribosome-associated toxin RatA of RatAB toxin-antitoxin module
VWFILADIDKEPYFWPSLNAVTNISKNGNTVEREVTIGFRNSKSCQTVMLNPRKSIEVSMISGPITGVRNILLYTSPMDDNKTRISILWDVDLSKVPVSNRTTTIKNIKKETVEALNRISQLVE